jgi:hypothetical protein
MSIVASTKRAFDQLIPPETLRGLRADWCDRVCLSKFRTEQAVMQIVQREFYRSARGPTRKDEDVWSLIFDSDTRRLVVRHEWETRGHSGFDEFNIDEFLAQEGAEQTALIDELFRPVLVDS